MIGIEKIGHSPGQELTLLSDPDFSFGAVEVGPQLGVQHPSYPEFSLSGLSARLVDPTGADHEQLQENEDWRRDQAEPELPSLFHQLLA